jgi:hypothetical protein
VFFLAGIILLGLISGPLQAADTPPTMWDKVFGSKSNPSDTESVKAKPKKTKTPKQTQKHQKVSKLGKEKADSNESESKNSGATTDQAIPRSQANAEQKNDPSSTKYDAPLPNSSTPESTPSSANFWGGLFSGASSTSPLLEGADKDLSNTAPQSASSPISQASVPAAGQSPDPANPATTSEPFWKGLFSSASSKPPESKAEPSAVEPSKAQTPNPVLTSTTPAQANTPPANSSKTNGAAEEGPSFWQKLFSNKSATNIKSSEPVAVNAPQPSTNESTAIALPNTVITGSNASDTKSNFALANVCERDKCELMIVYDVAINKANVEKFVHSTASIPAGTAVLFNSVDGDLNSGIRLGQVLRQKRFNSRIGRTNLNKKTLVETEGQCFSACVLAFSGGVNRRIDPNDQLGIYALRSNAKKVSEEDMRLAISGLSMYFDQMGIDRRLVQQMLQAKGLSVSLISLSNARLLNLDNSSRATTYPWRMQALDDGLLIALVTEKQSSGNYNVTLGLTKQNKDLRLTVFIKPTAGSINLTQLSDFLNRSPRPQLNISNQTLPLGLIKLWEPTSSGIQVSALLSEKESVLISSALELELDFPQLNKNAFNLDSVTIFGTSGLKGALATIK